MSRITISKLDIPRIETTLARRKCYGHSATLVRSQRGRTSIGLKIIRTRNQLGCERYCAHIGINGIIKDRNRDRIADCTFKDSAKIHSRAGSHSQRAGRTGLDLHRKSSAVDLAVALGRIVGITTPHGVQLQEIIPAGQPPDRAVIYKGCRLRHKGNLKAAAISRLSEWCQRLS